MNTPLLTIELPYLRAVDPGTGAFLWETIVGDKGQLSSSGGRFFVTRHGTFVMAGTRIWLIDLSDGRIVGGCEVPFTAEAAVFDGDSFYVAAPNHSAAAVGLNGKLRWKIGIEATGLLSSKYVCRDGEGQVLWERDAPEASTRAGANIGIALGDLIAQPDDKGMR